MEVRRKNLVPWHSLGRLGRRRLQQVEGSTVRQLPSFGENQAGFEAASGEEKSATEVWQRMAVFGLSLSPGVICLQDLTG